MQVTNATMTKAVIVLLVFALSTCDSCRGEVIPRLPVPIFKDDADTQSNLVSSGIRVVGGYPASWGEFTATISLQTRGGIHFCGATMIDPYHIVTSAHCLHDAKGVPKSLNMIQLMGADLVISRSGYATRQIRLPSRIFVNPYYKHATLENDVAVVRVSVPFYVTKIFAPVTRSAATPVYYKKCTVAGWGATEENGYASTRLQRVDIDVLDLNFCNAYDSYAGLLKPGMICAGSVYGSRDACQGDSGGGMICDGVLTGIVSFGHGCARPNYPGVYTDISYYNTFIDYAIRQR